MRRLALLAALLALALIAVLLVRESARPSESGSATPVALAPAQDAPAGLEPTANAREVLPAVAAAEPEPEPERAASAPARSAETFFEQRVIGRCMSAGVPQAGVEVALTSIEFPDRTTTHRTARTDVGGRFEIAALVRGNTQHIFRCTAPGLTKRTATLGASSPEPVIDLGDIEMPRAFELFGFVTTPDGRPIAEATVLARTDATFAADLEFGKLGLSGARTDATGRYAFFDLPIAEWTLSVSRRGLASSSTVSVLALNDRSLRVDLVATEVPAVSGRVLDEHGEPVAKLALKLVDASDGREQSWTTQSDASGAFELELVPKAEPASELKLVLEAGSIHAAKPLHCRWGDRDLSFVVRAQPAVRVRLVARETGRVIEHYRYRQAATAALDGVVRDAVVENGWTSVSLRSPELPFLWILPPAPYALEGPIDLAPYAREQRPLELALERARAHALRVIDRAGAAVEGAEVRILSVPTGADVRELGMLGIGDDGGLLWPGTNAWLWGRALTDSQGRAELHLPALEAVDLYLRLSLPGGGEHHAALREGAREQEIVVGVRGTAVQLEFTGEWPRGALLRLFDAAAPDALPVPLVRGFVAEEGDKALVPLPRAGEWALRMRVHEGECELRRVLVADGASTELVLASDEVFLPPATLRVQLAGQALASGELRFTLQRPDGTHAPMFRCAPRAGSIALPRLPIGTYSVVHDETGAGAPFDRSVLAEGVLELR